MKLTFKLKILNSREIKRIREKIVEQFGFFLTGDYAFLQNEKNRVFVVNKDIEKIDKEKLRIDRAGLYFAEIMKNEVRLSKSGVQLLANEAAKNGKKLKEIVELDKNELKSYFKGEDLSKDLGEDSRFILLKYDKEIFSCAKYKEKTIINFLPKVHRSNSVII